MSKNDQIFPNTKTVYGPVTSWRFGESVGIDPLFYTSTCSFNCIYCQLGHIQNITREFKEYVSTERVLQDFKELLESGKKIDVVTYSGSGEPSLASNLGEMIDGLRELAPNIPQNILTNATELWRDEVKENLFKLDKVILKLDAPTEDIFQKVNRPAPGLHLKDIVEGAKAFRKEYKGEVEMQSMFMPLNNREIEEYASYVREISPDVIQLNTPKRPYPLSWHRENRGNHKLIFDYEVRDLKKLDKEQAQELEDKLKALTGLPIISVYRN